MVVLKCHGSFGGITRSKVICLCLFFGFVVIEWCAVGIWKAFILQDSSLPNGQIAWTDTPYTLLDVLSISTRYEMAGNSITTCHPQSMNCKRTYEATLSTLYVINCLTWLFMWKLLQKHGKERERAEKDRQEAEQVRQELQNSCRKGTSMTAIPLDISMALVSTRGILTILYSGWGKYDCLSLRFMVYQSNNWWWDVENNWINDLSTG